MIPKDIVNDIMQLAKSVRSDPKKVAVSNIPTKDKFNSKAKANNVIVGHLDIYSLKNKLE